MYEIAITYGLVSLLLIGGFAYITFKMTKKWEYKFPKKHLNQRICDIRSEYGVTILSPEERLINNPIERLT